MIYVSMTDKFMSGWGPAKGKRNRLVIACETRTQADVIEAHARTRGEMIRIEMSETEPRERNGVIYTRRQFNDMGAIWKGQNNG